MHGYTYDITDEEISRLPWVSVTSPTTLVEDIGDARRAVEEMMRSLRNDSVVGFDMEMKPQLVPGRPRNPPSVIQIATEQEVYVFHLKKMSASFRYNGARTSLQQAIKILQPILNSEGKTVYKCGVALNGDLKLLQRFAPNVRTRDFVCMQLPAQQAGFRRRGLRALTAILLGQDLSKEEQLSDWGQANLSAAQVEYAATDAWVSREIALQLELMGHLRLGARSRCW